MTTIGTEAAVKAIDGLIAVMLERKLITEKQLRNEKPRTVLYEILAVKIDAALYNPLHDQQPAALRQKIADLEAQLAVLRTIAEPELPIDQPQKAEGPQE